ncbi:MAG: hypothetical protein ACKOFW_15950, partial [Planctomycetaceae bacterium]
MNDTSWEVRAIAGGPAERVTLAGYEEVVARVAAGSDFAAQSTDLTPLATASFLQGPDRGSASGGERVVGIGDDS